VIKASKSARLAALRRSAWLFERLLLLLAVGLGPGWTRAGKGVFLLVAPGAAALKGPRILGAWLAFACTNYPADPCEPLLKMPNLERLERTFWRPGFVVGRPLIVNNGPMKTKPSRMGTLESWGAEPIDAEEARRLPSDEASGCFWLLTIGFPGWAFCCCSQSDTSQFPTCS